MRSDGFRCDWTRSDASEDFRNISYFIVISASCGTFSDVFGWFGTWLDLLRCVPMGSEVFRYIQIYSDCEFYDRTFLKYDFDRIFL